MTKREFRKNSGIYERYTMLGDWNHEVDSNNIVKRNLHHYNPIFLESQKPIYKA